MVQPREPFIITRAARVILGVTIAVGLGAAVAASPVRVAPTSSPAAPIQPTPVDFKPLGDGPAVFVQKSFGKHDEDCVTVTQVKGADGRIYPTRGMVCAE